MTTIKLEGFAEVDAALEDLSKAAGKGVLRRAGIKALHPIAETAFNMAPDDPATGGYDLKASIGVSTKLSPRQKAKHRKTVRDDKSSVEVFVGAGPITQAHTVEFGTAPHINAGMFAGTQHPGTAPQPFMRPAWDAGKMGVLEDLKRELWAEIEKAAARAARKSARLAARG